jgi:hypothetical protein
VSRPLVPVPDRLRGLVDQHRPLGFSQPAVAARPERWAARLGAHASVLDTFPEQLDRDTVRGLTRSGSTDPEGVLVGFVATQIWGYGTTGYGPARLALALSYQGLPEVLREVGDRLASRDPVGAFRVLCVEHRIPRLGMAFGSKYLYFADPHRRTLILDQIVRDWLAEHARVWLGGRRDEREYAVWLLVAEQWSSSLGVASDQLEMLIFTDGSGRDVVVATRAGHGLGA